MSVLAAHELHPSPELHTSVYPDVRPHSQKIQTHVYVCEPTHTINKRKKLKLALRSSSLGKTTFLVLLYHSASHKGGEAAEQPAAMAST